MGFNSGFKGLTNCKGCGRKQSWFKFRYCTGIFPQVQWKTTNNSKHYSLFK